MLNRESSESTRESPTRLTTTFHRKLNAPRRTVFRLITDYEKLQETFPQIFLSFRVLERSRGEVVTEEKVFMVGVTMTQLCRHMTKSQTTHIVRIMTGDLAGSTIVERYSSDSDGGTTVHVEADFVLGGLLSLLPTFVARPLIENNVGRVFDELDAVLGTGARA